MHACVRAAPAQELGQWVLFDDMKLELVGDWHSVAHVMLHRRMQPSLLFYESA